MVQVSLEEDQIRFSEVLEEIRSFRWQRPVGQSSTPERMLFVDPLSTSLVSLPSLGQLTQRSNLRVGSAREQGSVHHRVQEPRPISLGDIRDEPGESFAVEVNFLGDASLDQPIGVDEVTVEFESGIVQDEVDSSTLHVGYELPNSVHVVGQDVLLS